MVERSLVGVRLHSQVLISARLHECPVHISIDADDMYNPERRGFVSEAHVERKVSEPPVARFVLVRRVFLGESFVLPEALGASSGANSWVDATSR